MIKESIQREPSTPETDLGRRTVLKATIAATAIAATAAPLIITSRKTEAQVPETPPSPPTTPWVEELPPAITPLAEVSLLSPAPSTNHQRYAELTAPGVSGPPKLYEMRAKENPSWVFNPAYPAQPIWGYAGSSGEATSPGPTIFGHYGQSVICRIHNDLPGGAVGFGSPEISTHLHNMHTPTESDGFPTDFYGPGNFHDHFYPNVCAGIDATHPRGDSNEALGTLWYHDHRMDFTAPNVYKGLAGFYLMFDDLDTGNEQTGLRLPSHPYDYPIVLQDRRFDWSEVLAYDQFNPEGTVGDKITVNGKIEPVLRVARRKYRLRFLNGGPTRFYDILLQNRGANAVYPFTYIANDGNLLPAPLLNQFRLRLAPAERGDIVVDFARFPLNTELYFVNQLLQVDTRGPGNSQGPGTRLLKVIVDRPPPAADTSQVPSVLRPLRQPTDAEKAAATPRRFVFARSGGLWTVNDQLFNPNAPTIVIPPGGAGEIWELVNPENGWVHPIHIHLEEGFIIGKTISGVNVPVPAHERGRKDVYVLGKNESLRVFIRFRDFTGKYVMHCHNLVHEDHAMMTRFDVI